MLWYLTILKQISLWRFLKMFHFFVVVVVLFSSYWWWYQLNDNMFICEVYRTLFYCTVHFYTLIITWPIIYRISSWKTWVARILNRRHSIYSWVIMIPTAVHLWYSSYHLELIPWLVCSSLLVTKALVETEFRLFHSAKDKWVALVYLKNALWVSMYLARKVLIEDTIFTSSRGDGTAILLGHPSNTKFSPFAGQRKNFHFSVILRPSLLRFAVRGSTVSANPAAVFVRVSWMQTQSYLWLITSNADNPVNQSEFTANQGAGAKRGKNLRASYSWSSFVFWLVEKQGRFLFLTNNNIQNQTSIYCRHSKSCITAETNFERPINATPL